MNDSTVKISRFHLIFEQASSCAWLLLKNHGGGLDASLLVAPGLLDFPPHTLTSRLTNCKAAM